MLRNQSTAVVLSVSSPNGQRHPEFVRNADSQTLPQKHGGEAGAQQSVPGQAHQVISDAC